MEPRLLDTTEWELNEKLIRRLKPSPVLVAGDVMVDEYVIGEVERISPESPVPVMVVRDRLRRLGGAGNVVKNLVSLGGSVALFGAVGEDTAGRWFRKHCEEIGIETFWLKADGSRPTTIKTRVVARNQQLVRIDEESDGDISPELSQAVIKEMGSVMPQVRAVVLSDYGKGFLTQDVTRAFIDSSKEHNLPVVVDPKGPDYSRYRGASYITPNVREASLASGVTIRDRESLVKAARILIDQTGATGIVVTRGKDGSTLVTNRKAKDFAVRPVEIIDVTGAGDTVVAALALSLANGMTIDQAISMANLAASIVVSRFGAASTTLEEMVERLNGLCADSKLVSKSDIAQQLRRHRLQGHRVVFTNGCFDLFHTGHLHTLRKAAEMGEILVVGLNSDASVKRIKEPGRPVVTEKDRAELISALPFVDYVVIFHEDTPANLIEEVRPDVLVKGDDWRGKKVVGEDLVKARGGKVEFVKHLDGRSTSQLLKKIRGD